jgi:hypothetical protein
MKKISNIIPKFFAGNLWVIFIINIKSFYESLIWIYKLFKTKIDMSDIPTQNLKFPLGYNELMLLILSVIMYSVFKLLIKYINDISIENTKNLNQISRVLDNKIRYVDFEKDNKHLDNDAYIKKLHSAGFSIEDLDEIGVNEDFINQNKDKLLPSIVIKKYLEFKDELDNHKNIKPKN